MADAEETTPTVAGDAAVEADVPATEGGPRERKHIPKPDRRKVEQATEVVNKEIQGINDEIAKLDKRIEEIKAQIDQANENRSEGQDELGRERAKMSELRAERDEIKRARDAISNELDKMKGKVDSAVEAGRSAKSNMRFRTVEEIDAEILRLQRQQTSTSMTLAEEKRVVKEIDQLKSNRRTLQSLGQSQDQITRDKEEKGRIQDQLKQKKAELSDVISRIEAQQKVLEGLNATGDEKRGKIPTLIQERKGLSEKKKELVQQIRDLQKKTKDLWEDFKQKKREFDVLMAEERERRDAERKARQEAWEKQKEEEELKKVPYEDEMALCDYLVNYLKVTFIDPQNAAATSGGAAEAKKTPQTLEHDGKVLQALKRDDSDDEAPIRKKKGGGGGGKKQKAKKDTIVHSPDTLDCFLTVGLEAPPKISAVAASIEALKAKKSWYSVQPRPVKAPKKTQTAEESTTEEGTTEKAPEKPSRGKKAAKEFVVGEEDFPTLSSVVKTEPANGAATTAAATTAGADAAEEN